MSTKIRGVNLGNWLVLERWMEPELFRGTDAEDETWLRRLLPEPELRPRLRAHRDSWIRESDFQWLAEQGVNLVRIPVPYFLFGDVWPFDDLTPWLDRAFDWAEKTGICVLLDLHTTPGNQNGYDNGGLVGVCRWCRDPEQVEYVHTVLERLAERYGKRAGLFGIEVLNEPISFLVYHTAPTTGRARDVKEAEGSGHVPLRFLRRFYRESYGRLRAILPEEKAIVFHDGFRLLRWNRFFRKSGMKNVYLDTHQYIWAMEMFLPVHRMWAYRLFIAAVKRMIRRVRRDVPVLVGEWCLCTRHASFSRNHRYQGSGTDIFGVRHRKPDWPEEEKRERHLEIRRHRQLRYLYTADLELSAFNEADGWIYWSYKLCGDRELPRGESWKEGWDFRRCVRNHWLPELRPVTGGEAANAAGTPGIKL